MKRISLIVLIVASSVVICLTGAASQTQRPQPQVSQTTMTAVQRQQIVLEKTVGTQQRINRYFHGEVIPKLRNCWSRLKGQGTLEIEHSYKRDATGKWVADKMTISQSTLPRAQTAVALRCMQNSARGTAFRVENTDGNGSTYTVNWTWPVPFPADADALTTAMFAAKPKGSGSGGCDGRGATAKCYICDGLKCVKVCVGYKTCRLYSVQSGQFCTESDDCASGGPFHVTGGTYIR